MTHAERARIKRQMSIGEYPGENDLNANEFRVKTYVHVGAEKYVATLSNGMYCTWAAGGAIYRETLKKLREALIAALAERAPAVPVPDSVAWVGIDWGASTKLLSRLLEIPRNHASPAP